jgi:hypothetical protein
LSDALYAARSSLSPNAADVESIAAAPTEMPRSGRDVKRRNATMVGEVMRMAAKTQVQPTVSVAAIAAELGGMGELVHALAGQLGIPIETDWAGNLAVTVGDTQRIVQHFREDQGRMARLRTEYEAYTQGWERRRHQAGEQACLDTVRRLRDRDIRSMASGGITSLSLASSLSRRVGQHGTPPETARDRALAEFDRKKPLQSFTEWSQ